MSILEKLEWALHTVREKLTFGMQEGQAIMARENRVRGVLMDAVKEVAALQAERDGYKEALEKFANRDQEFYVDHYRVTDTGERIGVIKDIFKLMLFAQEALEKKYE